MTIKDFGTDFRQLQNVIAVDDVFAVGFDPGIGRTTEPVAMMMLFVAMIVCCHRRR